MALGESFSPATPEEQQMDPRLRKRRTPVQQALQTVSLKMPAYTGQNALTGRLLAGQPGAGAANAAAGTPGLQTMLNALMGPGSSSTSGFGGGGFGLGGPVASAGAGAKGPMKGTVGKPPGGPGKPPGPSAAPKPPGGGGGFQLPGGLKPPSLGSLPGKVSDVISGITGGGGGGFQLPGSLKPPSNWKPPSKPKPPSMPPINPNIPGGGLLDHLVSPPPTPPVITPPSPPPVSFGGGGPSFTTPTGGAGQAGNVPQGGYSQPGGGMPNAPQAPQGTWVKNPSGYAYFIPGLTGSAMGVPGYANQRPPGY